MSTINPIHFLFSFILPFSFLKFFCFCMITENWNSSSTQDTFSAAVATWYGEPNGAGSDGGACGYRSDVEKPPFSRMISAGNAHLYQSGLGCGSCYQVKCSENSACSGEPITVTITDECACDSENVHFDLSGTAFGAMALPGHADILRQAGKFNVLYRRVPCNYGGTPISFKVDSGSNPYYFACVVEHEMEDGDLSLVELKISGNSKWMSMQHSWGATWKIDLGSGMQAPFSIRLTTLQTEKVIIVAKDVIPANWKPGNSYRSLVH